MPALLLLLSLAFAQDRVVSAARMDELAARSPAIFDVFFEREAADVRDRPRFRTTAQMAIVDGMQAPLAQADVPATLSGGRITLSSVFAVDGERGWRAGVDSTIVDLDIDEDALRQLEQPTSLSWRHQRQLAYVGRYDRDRALSWHAGLTTRSRPIVGTDATRTFFATTRQDGGLETVDTRFGLSGHVRWGPAGELAVALDETGVDQAHVRRPFAVPRTDGVGPLLGAVPELGLYRGGAFVRGLEIVPRRVRLDASAAARTQAGERAGFDHAAFALDAPLKHDPDPPDPDHRMHTPADHQPGIALRARGSAWRLADGVRPGGAGELAVTDIVIKQKVELDVMVGGAWNDYRAMGLLAVADLPLLTVDLDLAW
jgi:hypothetical protein